MNYYAFCSFLPGATTTQLLCLIAYRKGGLKLAILSMLVWITPSFIILLLLSLFFIRRDIFVIADDIFLFFNPMVVSFMIYAAIRFNNYHQTSKRNIFKVFLNVLLIILFFKHPFIIPILFIINGLYAHLSNNGQLNVLYSNFAKRLSINYRILTIYISLFAIFAISSEYSRKFETKNRYYFNILEHNFRFGSLVYGGGDVLIPLMYEQYISRPTSQLTQRRNPEALSLNKHEFMTAAGVIRLIPGPVFAITSFTTPYLLPNFQTEEKVLASMLATISIFLPGILILLIVSPLSHKLFSNKSFSNIIAGVNLTVLSIMIASSLYLTYDLCFIESESITQASQNVATILVFLILLIYSKLSHASIALLSITIGVLIHFL